MERFPSKNPIEFEFNISSEPCYPLDNKAMSDIEGKLSIVVDGQRIFDEEDILLAELSACLYKWMIEVEEHKNTTLVYESMDYEDAPILKVELSGNAFEITSEWLCSDVESPVLVDLSKFITAVKSYLDAFEKAVPGISKIY